MGAATTIDDYINHPTRRGNGQLGQNSARFVLSKQAARLVLKTHQTVHKVITQLHESLVKRYVAI